MSKGTCSVRACERPAIKREWCEKHYQRWRLRGDPEAVVAYIQGDAPARFASKVRLRLSGCVDWVGLLDTNGYGTFWNGTRTVKAHRWAWEALNGPVPEGLVLDHLCRRRCCVNPAHLEPVTQAVNTRRGWAANKVACKHGHLYADHLYVNSEGRRTCGLCRTLQQGHAPKKRIDVDRMVALYGSGLSTIQVGREMGLDASTVSRRLRRAGVTMRPPGSQVAFAYDEAVIALHDAGYRSPAIQAATGASPATVSSILKRHGRKGRPGRPPTSELARFPYPGSRS